MLYALYYQLGAKSLTSHLKIKTEKKNSELSMCPICKKCKDRSVCQNRKNKKRIHRKIQ